MRVDGKRRRAWQGPRLYQSDFRGAMPGCRSRNGTVLNAPFTIRLTGRYTGAMMLAVLASAAAAAQPPVLAPRAGAAVQARASVRILSGERISFERYARTDQDRPRRWRDTVLVVDGKPITASFLEFE